MKTISDKIINGRRIITQIPDEEDLQIHELTEEEIQKEIEEGILKKYSKRQIMLGLKKIHVWEQVKQWMIKTGYIDDWDTAIVLESTDEFFKIAVKTFKEKFNVTDEIINNILEPAILYEI